MKKVVLILFSVACALILAGFCLAAAGGFKFRTGTQTRVSTDGDYPRLSQPQTQEQSADPQNCRSIKLDLVNTDLKVAAYDGTVIRLTYESLYKNEWKYTKNGDEIHLENEKYRHGVTSVHNLSSFLSDLFNGDFNFDGGDDSGGNGNKHTVELDLPKSAAASLTVNNVNGTVAIGGVSMKALGLSLVNSDLTVESTSVEDQIKATDVNGSINFKDTSAPKLTFSGIVNGDCTVENPQFAEIDSNGVVNGSLRLTGVKDSNDYAVDSSGFNGSVNIGGNRYSGAKAHIGPADAKYSVHFSGTNSDLYIGQ